MTADPRKPRPEELIGAALDGLDIGQTESLLGALESEPEAAERLKAYARQKRRLWRTANAMEGAEPDATKALVRKLAGRLRSITARRWVGALATAMVLGWAVGEISDRLLLPDSYYGFETADFRVVRPAPGNQIVLSAAQATPGRLSNWIHRPVIVPNLKTAGLTFVSARLVDMGEIRLVGLVYRGADGDLIFCQSPDLDGQRENPELLRTADVQAGYWSDGSRTFALMAGLHRPDVPGLVRKFSRLTLTGPGGTLGA